MYSNLREVAVLLTVATLTVTNGFAQKVETGYDKSANFAKYRSYTLREPAHPSTGRPILYITVMGTIRGELESKGLASKEMDGDLTVIPAGSLDYGFGSASGFTADSCSNCKKPLADPMEWTGTQAPPGSSGKPMPKGVLELDIVDRSTNKVVWSGTVQQKLDPNKKQQSLDKVGTAIKKLLADFPPKPQ